MNEPRRYWVAPYGGSIGALIALLILIAVVVLFLIHTIDGGTAVLVGGLALARLL